MSGIRDKWRQVKASRHPEIRKALKTKFVICAVSKNQVPVLLVCEKCPEYQGTKNDELLCRAEHLNEVELEALRQKYQSTKEERRLQDHMKAMKEASQHG